jgi:siroheme synthase (precorrin-2 oxidase/ferrochelatase)
VNRADDGDPPGDFVTPASWRRGPVTLAVTAGSAAISAAIRDDAVSMLDDRLLRMAEVMVELRPRIRDSGLDASVRAEIFRDLAGEEALGVFTADGAGGIRRWLGLRHPDLKL